MTALCGGGPSQAKTGYGTTLIIPVSLIAAGLGLYSPWLIPVSAFLEGYTMDLVASCTVDPPALPTFNLTDVAALVGGPLNPGFAGLLAKVQAVIQHYFWFQYCQCTPPTGTPAIDPAPKLPDGVGQAPGGGGVQCFAGSYTGAVPSQQHPIGGQQLYNITTQVLPVGPGAPITATSGFTGQTIYPIPATATTLVWQSRSQLTQGCGQSPGDFNNLFFYRDAGTVDSGVRLQGSAIGQLDWQGTVAIPAAARYYLLIWGTGDEGFCGQNLTNASLNVQTWCGGPPGSAQACCPPDPALLNLVNQVYQLTAQIFAGQITPARSYISGTLHSNLSGNGSFALESDTIAVRIAIQSGIPVDRFYAGEFNYYFDVGHLYLITNSAPIQSVRLVFQNQVVPIHEIADSIGWTLSAGVVIQITELKRGV